MGRQAQGVLMETFGVVVLFLVLAVIIWVIFTDAFE